MALEASVRQAMARKLAEMKPQMDEAVTWIEAVTGLPMEGTFDEWLRSGVVLCTLVNKISPGSVKKINKGSMPFMQMENISQFIRVAKHMGLKESDCFDTVDLYKGNDIGKVVSTIHAFGSLVQTRGDYDGPQLGVKFAQANKREFTEEQLREGRTATSKIAQGSAGHMERSEVTKQGITFGNTAAGGAGSSEVTKTTAGSAGIMQRSSIKKQGITFGNEAAGGAGSSEVTRATAGSAGVMERAEIKKQGITFGHDHAGEAEDSADLSKTTAGSAGIMERTDIKKRHHLRP
ncbi:hypothetical protein CTAYLR_010252 [Chrysophaeum taylorii]|uniref:Calponin-homology (CH) domain-containing protein n=1 Tax=Chrysophaeum taylorii TaxID=2483200 RepID=A0AAD7XN07_9STRA|nr:hypothetical protein CTAYLR_010252 [Chrysophaeum taylorii]